MNLSNEDSADMLLKIHKDLISGLLYTTAASKKTPKTLESTSFLYALIELLIKKGLLTTEESDERKRQVAERLVKRFVKAGSTSCIRTTSTTNTTFDQEADVDCERRPDICKALCRKLPFVLSKRTWKRGSHARSSAALI